MSRLRKTILAAGLAAALLVAVAVSGCGGGASPEAAADEAATTAGGAPSGSEEMRTVVVSSDAEPDPSRPGKPLHALRLKGSVPSRPVAATVLTDEDCAPDAAGVSHCTNRLRLASGRVLVVRHPHRMMEVSCLAPGERIMVRPS